MLETSMTETPEHYQAYIVNLSTINKLAPLHEVLNKFADLHYDHANSWLHFKWFSKLWTRWKFFTHRTLINQYKLGKIDTQSFIGQLVTTFYFLESKVIDPKLALENAWNSLVVCDDQSTTRVKYLLQLNKPIYFISNTNELNIQKIKQAINRAQKKRLLWEKTENEFEGKEEQTKDTCTFEVCENISLMTSYANATFNTTGLLEKLANYLILEKEINAAEIMLVSQYDPDLELAKKSKLTTKSADEFFKGVLLQKNESSPELINIPEGEEAAALAPQPAAEPKKTVQWHSSSSSISSMSKPSSSSAFYQAAPENDDARNKEKQATEEYSLLEKTTNTR